MPPDQPNHAIRDGDNRVIYISGERGGLYKYLPDANLILPYKTISYPTQAGQMAGYAGYQEPQIVVELLLPAQGSGLSPTQYGVWRHVPGTGWTRTFNGLPVQKQVLWVTASPSDPSTWLAYVDNANDGSGVVASGLMRMADGSASCFYRTTDNGATWSAVDVSLSGYTGFQIRRVEWSYSVPGRWAAIGRVTGGTPPSGHVGDSALLVVTGAGGAATATTYLPPTQGIFSSAQSVGFCAGAAGEFWLIGNASFFSGNHWEASITAANAYAQSAGFPGNLLDLYAEPSALAAFPRRILAVSVQEAGGSGALPDGNGYSTSDYHAATVSAGPTSVGKSIAVVQGGVFVATRSTGVLQFATEADFLTGSGSVDAATSGLPTGLVRGDRQQRSVVAARKNSTTTADVLVWADGAWQTVTGPGAGIQGDGGFVEPVLRSSP